ncbi:hypothetical protein [Mesorhizobium sp. B4-1-4]|uniref:hypothetical protein n=1 Tax=Mesorhizobium sp. B4-1-4 TaxID=2589888 RepID=UPI0015E36A10|nr:hypothetical protein [Mesorhizobium sp. B4-1-4]UCI31908.1 hypothetical protein FJW03_29955 [Mesorhizobium sp. B4-1-4]
MNAVAFLLWILMKAPMPAFSFCGGTTCASLERFLVSALQTTARPDLIQDAEVA